VAIEVYYLFILLIF